MSGLMLDVGANTSSAFQNLGKLDSQLDALVRSSQLTNRTLEMTNRTNFSGISSSLGDLSNRMLALTASTARFAANIALPVSSVTRLSSEIARATTGMTGLYDKTAALQALVRSGDSLTELVNMAGRGDPQSVALARINSMAAETRSGQAEIARLYGSVRRSLPDVQGKDIEQMTKTFMKGAQLSGASREGSSAAVLQFTQAMSAGVLRGEEYNTMLEQVPVLMESMARSMGKTMGQMREMAHNGKLTSELVVTSFGKMASSIDKEFKGVHISVNAASMNLRDSLSFAFGSMVRDSGALNVVSSSLDRMASKVQKFSAIRPLAQSAGKSFANVIRTAIKDKLSAEEVSTILVKQRWLSTPSQVAKLDGLRGATRHAGLPDIKAPPGYDLKPAVAKLSKIMKSEDFQEFVPDDMMSDLHRLTASLDSVGSRAAELAAKPIFGANTIAASETVARIVASLHAGLTPVVAQVGALREKLKALPGAFTALAKPTSGLSDILDVVIRALSSYATAILRMVNIVVGAVGGGLKGSFRTLADFAVAVDASAREAVTALMQRGASFVAAVKQLGLALRGFYSLFGDLAKKALPVIASTAAPIGQQLDIMYSGFVRTINRAAKGVAAAQTALMSAFIPDTAANSAVFYQIFNSGSLAELNKNLAGGLQKVTANLAMDFDYEFERLAFDVEGMYHNGLLRLGLIDFSQVPAIRVPPSQAGATFRAALFAALDVFVLDAFTAALGRVERAVDKYASRVQSILSRALTFENGIKYGQGLRELLQGLLNFDPEQAATGLGHRVALLGHRLAKELYNVFLLVKSTFVGFMAGLSGVALVRKVQVVDKIEFSKRTAVGRFLRERGVSVPFTKTTRMQKEAVTPTGEKLTESAALKATAVAAVDGLLDAAAFVFDKVRRIGVPVVTTIWSRIKLRFGIDLDWDAVREMVYASLRSLASLLVPVVNITAMVTPHVTWAAGEDLGRSFADKLTDVTAALSNFIRDIASMDLEGPLLGVLADAFKSIASASTGFVYGFFDELRLEFAEQLKRVDFGAAFDGVLGDLAGFVRAVGESLSELSFDFSPFFSALSTAAERVSDFGDSIYDSVAEVASRISTAFSDVHFDVAPMADAAARVAAHFRNLEDALSSVALVSFAAAMEALVASSETAGGALRQLRDVAAQGFQIAVDSEMPERLAVAVEAVVARIREAFDAVLAFRIDLPDFAPLRATLGSVRVAIGKLSFESLRASASEAADWVIDALSRVRDRLGELDVTGAIVGGIEAAVDRLAGVIDRVGDLLRAGADVLAGTAVVALPTVDLSSVQNAAEKAVAAITALRTRISASVSAATDIDMTPLTAGVKKATAAVAQLGRQVSQIRLRLPSVDISSVHTASADFVGRISESLKEALPKIGRSFAGVRAAAVELNAAMARRVGFSLVDIAQLAAVAVVSFSVSNALTRLFISSGLAARALSLFSNTATNLRQVGAVAGGPLTTLQAQMTATGGASAATGLRLLAVASAMGVVRASLANLVLLSAATLAAAFGFELPQKALAAYGQQIQAVVKRAVGALGDLREELGDNKEVLLGGMERGSIALSIVLDKGAQYLVNGFQTGITTALSVSPDVMPTFGKLMRGLLDTTVYILMARNLGWKGMALFANKVNELAASKKLSNYSSESPLLSFAIHETGAFIQRLAADQIRGAVLLIRDGLALLPDVIAVSASLFEKSMAALTTSFVELVPGWLGDSLLKFGSMIVKVLDFVSGFVPFIGPILELFKEPLVQAFAIPAALYALTSMTRLDKVGGWLFGRDVPLQKDKVTEHQPGFFDFARSAIWNTSGEHQRSPNRPMVASSKATVIGMGLAGASFAYGVAPIAAAASALLLGGGLVASASGKRGIAPALAVGAGALGTMAASSMGGATLLALGLTTAVFGILGQSAGSAFLAKARTGLFDIIGDIAGIFSKAGGNFIRNAMGTPSEPSYAQRAAPKTIHGLQELMFRARTHHSRVASGEMSLEESLFSDTTPIDAKTYSRRLTETNKKRMAAGLEPVQEISRYDRAPLGGSTDAWVRKFFRLRDGGNSSYNAYAAADARFNAPELEPGRRVLEEEAAIARAGTGSDYATKSERVNAKLRHRKAYRATTPDVVEAARAAEKDLEAATAAMHPDAPQNTAWVAQALSSQSVRDKLKSWVPKTRYAKAKASFEDARTAYNATGSAEDLQKFTNAQTAFESAKTAHANSLVTRALESAKSFDMTAFLAKARAGLATQLSSLKALVPKTRYARTEDAFNKARDAFNKTGDLADLRKFSDAQAAFENAKVAQANSLSARMLSSLKSFDVTALLGKARASFATATSKKDDSAYKTFLAARSKRSSPEFAAGLDFLEAGRAVAGARKHLEDNGNDKSARDALAAAKQRLKRLRKATTPGAVSAAREVDDAYNKANLQGFEDRYAKEALAEKRSRDFWSRFQSAPNRQAGFISLRGIDADRLPKFERPSAQDLVNTAGRATSAAMPYVKTAARTVDNMIPSATLTAVGAAASASRMAVPVAKAVAERAPDMSRRGFFKMGRNAVEMVHSDLSAAAEVAGFVPAAAIGRATGKVAASVGRASMTREGLTGGRLLRSIPATDSRTRLEAVANVLEAANTLHKASEALAKTDLKPLVQDVALSRRGFVAGMALFAGEVAAGGQAVIKAQGIMARMRGDILAHALNVHQQAEKVVQTPGALAKGTFGQTAYTAPLVGRADYFPVQPATLAYARMFAKFALPNLFDKLKLGTRFIDPTLSIDSLAKKARARVDALDHPTMPPKPKKEPSGSFWSRFSSPLNKQAGFISLKGIDTSRLRTLGAQDAVNATGQAVARATPHIKGAARVVDKAIPAATLAAVATAASASKMVVPAAKAMANRAPDMSRRGFFKAGRYAAEAAFSDIATAAEAAGHVPAASIGRATGKVAASVGSTTVTREGLTGGKLLRAIPAADSRMRLEAVARVLESANDLHKTAESLSKVDLKPVVQDVALSRRGFVAGLALFAGEIASGGKAVIKAQGLMARMRGDVLAHALNVHQTTERMVKTPDATSKGSFGKTMYTAPLVGRQDHFPVQPPGLAYARMFAKIAFPNLSEKLKLSTRFIDPTLSIDSLAKKARARVDALDQHIMPPKPDRVALAFAQSQAYKRQRGGYLFDLSPKPPKPSKEPSGSFWSRFNSPLNKQAGFISLSGLEPSKVPRPGVAALEQEVAKLRALNAANKLARKVLAPSEKGMLDNVAMSRRTFTAGLAAYAASPSSLRAAKLNGRLLTGALDGDILSQSVLATRAGNAVAPTGAPGVTKKDKAFYDLGRDGLAPVMPDQLGTARFYMSQLKPDLAKKLKLGTRFLDSGSGLPGALARAEKELVAAGGNVEKSTGLFRGALNSIGEKLRSATAALSTPRVDAPVDLSKRRMLGVSSEAASTRKMAHMRGQGGFINIDALFGWLTPRGKKEGSADKPPEQAKAVSQLPRSVMQGQGGFIRFSSSPFDAWKKKKKVEREYPAMHQSDVFGAVNKQKATNTRLAEEIKSSGARPQAVPPLADIVMPPPPVGALAAFNRAAGKFVASTARLLVAATVAVSAVSAAGLAAAAVVPPLAAGYFAKQSLFKREGITPEIVAMPLQQRLLMGVASVVNDVSQKFNSFTKAFDPAIKALSLFTARMTGAMVTVGAALNGPSEIKTNRAARLAEAADAAKANAASAQQAYLTALANKNAYTGRIGQKQDPSKLASLTEAVSSAAAVRDAAATYSTRTAGVAAKAATAATRTAGVMGGMGKAAKAVGGILGTISMALIGITGKFLAIGLAVAAVGAAIYAAFLGPSDSIKENLGWMYDKFTGMLGFAPVTRGGILADIVDVAPKQKVGDVDLKLSRELTAIDTKAMSEGQKTALKAVLASTNLELEELDATYYKQGGKFTKEQRSRVDAIQAERTVAIQQVPHDKNFEELSSQRKQLAATNTDLIPGFMERMGAALKPAKIRSLAEYREKVKEEPVDNAPGLSRKEAATKAFELRTRFDNTIGNFFRDNFDWDIVAPDVIPESAQEGGRHRETARDITRTYMKDVPTNVFSGVFGERSDWSRVDDNPINKAVESFGDALGKHIDFSRFVPAAPDTLLDVTKPLHTGVSREEAALIEWRRKAALAEQVKASNNPYGAPHPVYNHPPQIGIMPEGGSAGLMGQHTQMWLAQTQKNLMRTVSAKDDEPTRLQDMLTPDMRAMQSSAFDDYLEAKQNYISLYLKGALKTERGAAKYERDLKAAADKLMWSGKRVEDMNTTLGAWAETAYHVRAVNKGLALLGTRSKERFNLDFGKDGKAFGGDSRDKDEMNALADSSAGLENRQDTSMEAHRETVVLRTAYERRAKQLEERINARLHADTFIDWSAKAGGVDPEDVSRMMATSATHMSRQAVDTPVADMNFASLVLSKDKLQMELNTMASDAAPHVRAALLAKLSDLNVRIAAEVKTEGWADNINKALKDLNLSDIQIPSAIYLREESMMRLAGHTDTVKNAQKAYNEAVKDGKTPFEEKVRLLRELLNLTNSLRVATAQETATAARDLMQDASKQPAVKALELGKMAGLKAPDSVTARPALSAKYAQATLKLLEGRAKQELGVDSNDGKLIVEGARAMDSASKLHGTLSSASNEKLEVNFAGITSALSDAGVTLDGSGFAALPGEIRRVLVAGAWDMAGVNKRLEKAQASGDGSGIASLLTAKETVQTRLFDVMRPFMFSTGKALSGALSAAGVGEGRQANSAQLSNAVEWASALQALEHAMSKKMSPEDAAANLSKQAALKRKQSYQTEDLASGFDKQMQQVNSVFGAALTEMDFASMGERLRGSLSSVAKQLQRDLTEAYTKGTPEAIELLVQKAKALADVGKTITFNAELRRSRADVLTEGTSAAFERIKAALPDSNIELADFRGADPATRRKLAGEANIRTQLDKAMDLPNLTEGLAAILNDVSLPAEARLAAFSSQFETDLGKSWAEFNSTPLERNNTLLEANVAALAQNTAAVLGKAPAAAPAKGAVGEISAETFKASAVANKAWGRNVTEALSTNLRTDQRLARRYKNANIDGTAVAMATPEQAGRLTSMASRFGALDDAQNTPGATFTRDMAIERESLSNEMAGLQQSIRDRAMLLTTEGTRFADSVTSGFASTFVDALKGKTAEGKSWFATLASGVLGQFTNSVIDSFAKGLLEPFLGKGSALFSGLRGLGGDVVKDGLSLGGGVVKDGLSLGAAATEGDKGFLDTITSGLGSLFGKSTADIAGPTMIVSAITASTGAIVAAVSSSAAISSGGSLMGLAGKADGLSGLFKGFATGGAISGPGTGTSDSIPALLSNGEFVVNAAATSRNRALLTAINTGTIARFATGGLVGSAPVVAGPSMVVPKKAATQEGAGPQVFNIHITGDISRQTKKEIMQMLPTIAAGVNQNNRERGIR